MQASKSISLSARDLAIVWGDDSRYWRWPLMKDSSGECISVAELIEVCWLEVTGKIKTCRLQPGRVYEAAFAVMIKDHACGFDLPVNLKLTLPCGKTQEHKVILADKPKGQWIEIRVGEFETTCESTGEIEFSLNGSEGLYWKKGLVVKGASVKEKYVKPKPVSLSARDLTIIWGDDKRYWAWPLMKDSSGECISVAELLNVCWLEVKGKYNKAKLQSGKRYEVVFDVKLNDQSYGWETPVDVSLTLPCGRKQEHKVCMLEKPREKWIEIRAGEFETTCGNMGEIEFSLNEIKGGKWKKGLIVKGVSIKPIGPLA